MHLLHHLTWLGVIHVTFLKMICERKVCVNSIWHISPTGHISYQENASTRLFLDSFIAPAISILLLRGCLVSNRLRPISVFDYIMSSFSVHALSDLVGGPTHNFIRNMNGIVKLL